MQRSAILLCLLLLACGQDGPDSSATKKPPRVPPPGNPNLGSIVTVSDPGSSDARRDEAPGQDFRLEVFPGGETYVPGGSFSVRLLLKNTGSTPWRLFRPEESLAEDLRVRAVRPDGTTGIIESHLELPEGDITEADLRVVKPGATIGAQARLGPLLHTLTWGQPGTHRVEIAFIGGYQGARHGMDIWNRAGTRQVTATDFPVRVGGDEAAVVSGDRGVLVLLSDTGPNARVSGSAKREIVAMGAAAYPALIRSLHLVESPLRRDQSTGWGAFEILFEAGPEVLAGVSPSSADRRSHEYLRVLLDQREAEEKGDVAAAVLCPELFDPSRSAALLYRLTRHGIDRTSEVLTVHGDGIVETEVHRANRVTGLRGSLDPTGLHSFKDDLVRGRFWLQQGIRLAGMKDEALLVFEELRFEPVAGVAVEKSLRRFEVWEEEAFLNMSLSRIVTAFDVARGAAR